MADRSHRSVVALSLGALVALALSAISACNSISGIDDLVVGGGADSGGPNDDATTGDGSSGADGQQASDAHADGAENEGSASDSNVAADGASDGSQQGQEAGDSAQPSDAAPDATTDASLDAAVDGAASDAPSDSPAAGPCDGGSALVVHNNGFGQTFSDCQPLGTYNVAQATEACAASTGDAGACVVNPGGLSCSGGNSVCNVTSSTCSCWRYDSRPGATGYFTGACGCISNSAAVTWN